MNTQNGLIGFVLNLYVGKGLKGFILFFLPRAKTNETQTHKTTHLQTAASQPCKPKFAKELFFCQRTSAL